MKYFKGITNLEQAKLYYKKLAKKLHPDMGGSDSEFQLLQSEYSEVLLSLQQTPNSVNGKKQSDESELLNELAKLAKVLIKKQVPQQYLRQKIEATESSLKRSILGNIANFFDDL